MVWMIKLNSCSDGIHNEISYHTIDTKNCPVIGEMLTNEGILAISKEMGRHPENIKLCNGGYERWETVASGDKAIAIQDALNDMKMLRDRLGKYGINIKLEIV